MAYLTSSEALGRLCEIRPYRPIRGAIKNIATGFASFGAGAGIWFYLPDIPIWIVPFIELNHIGYAATGIFGLYKLVDGVTSIYDHLPWRANRQHSVEGSTIIHRNDGYTNIPTKSDIRFGHRVVPVDNVAELGKTSGQGLLRRDQVLLNGVVLRGKTFRKKIERRSGGTVRRRFVTVPQERYMSELFPSEYRVEIGG